jgi:outer membrane protein assembly factor BamE (lipoprotein component of BamABCDE complex)
MCLMLAACAKHEITQGYNFDNADLKVIRVHQSTKEDVRKELGSPTTSSDFGPLTYYYISTKLEKIAFFEPKVVEQRALSICFNSKGVVDTIKELTLDDYNMIVFSESLTEIDGNTLSPLEQMMSNVGKYNKNIKKRR